MMVLLGNESHKDNYKLNKASAGGKNVIVRKSPEKMGWLMAIIAFTRV
jgi:hypothetical protein